MIQNVRNLFTHTSYRTREGIEEPRWKNSDWTIFQYLVAYYMHVPEEKEISLYLYISFKINRVIDVMVDSNRQWQYCLWMLVVLDSIFI